MRGLTISIDSTTGQSNRLFIIIAVALIGFICIGLLGLGGAIFLIQTRQAQEAVVAPAPAVFLPTPTATSTSTATGTPTSTPQPTPTGTRVVVRTGEGAGAPEVAGQQPTAEATVEPTEEFGGQPAETPVEVTPTNTLVVQPPTETITSTATVTPTTPPSEIPQGGGVVPLDGNRFLLWAGAALLLVLIVGIVSHLRSPSRPT